MLIDRTKIEEYLKNFQEPNLTFVDTVLHYLFVYNHQVEEINRNSQSLELKIIEHKLGRLKQSLDSWSKEKEGVRLRDTYYKKYVPLIQVEKTNENYNLSLGCYVKSSEESISIILTIQ